MSKSLGNIVVPWDVIDRTAPTRSAGTSSPPSSRGTATCSTPTRSASRCASSCCSCGTRTASTSCTRTSTTSTELRRAGDRARPLGALAPARDDVEVVARPARRLRRHARRPGDRRVRRRALELVRAPLAAALLGRRPGGVRDAAPLPGRRRAAARAVHPVRRRRDLRQPRRRRAERAPVRLARRPARATRSSSSRWPSCARPCGSGSPPAARPSSGPPAAARGRRRRRRRRARRRSSGSRTSCSTSSTSSSSATSRRPTSSAPTRSSPTTARSARASASTCRRWRPPSPRSTPRTSRTRCATTGRSAITSTATTTSSAPDDLLLAMRPLDGYQLEREGSHAVALELELDEALCREGLAREIVHAVQNARKTAGLRDRGPDRADARRRRRAARRRPRARAVRDRRDARGRRHLRRRVGGRGGDRQGPPPADRRAPRSADHARTSAGNGKAEVPVDYSLDDLKPRTRYHYRLVAIVDGTTTKVLGADATFKTSRSLAVSVVGHKVKPAKNGKATFTLKAVGPPDTTATGIATVKAVIGKPKQTILALSRIRSLRARRSDVLDPPPRRRAQRPGREGPPEGGPARAREDQRRQGHRREDAQGGRLMRAAMKLRRCIAEVRDRRRPPPSSLAPSARAAKKTADRQWQQRGRAVPARAVTPGTTRSSRRLKFVYTAERRQRRRQGRPAAAAASSPSTPGPRCRATAAPPTASCSSTGCASTSTPPTS